MKKVFFVMVLLLTLSFRIEAQKTLTLDEAISTALNESYSIKSAEQTLISSQKNLESIKMGLRSSVDFEFDIPRYSRSLSSQFNPLTGTEQFFTVGNTTVEGRLSINQPILFTNGTVSIVSSIFGRDQFADMSGTTRDYFSNLSIRLNQPLFTFNSQLGNLERAEINLEKTKRNYSRAEREIIYNVTASFYNLYKAKKSVEITEEKVKQTEDSYTTAMNKFKAGLIAEVEALQLEVDYAASKNELLNVKQIYEEAKNDFKLLIGLNINEDVDILAQLEYSPLELNIDDAVKSALNNRPEVLNSEADLELGKLNIDEVDSRRTIKAELNANYGINKNDNKFDSIFNNFADSRSVTMTVYVPILDWGKNSYAVEAAYADYKMTELFQQNLKKQIEKEVTSAINRLNSSKARVEILKKGVEIAEKSYSISLERFKSGHITSFNLSQMQLKLTDSKMNNLSAIIDYKLALADLERKTYKLYH